MFCLASRDRPLHVPSPSQKILDWNALNGILTLLFVLSCITPYCWTGSPRVTQNLLSFLFLWIIKLLFFRGGACYTACGILVPWGGVEPGPLDWEHGVLTTRPGNATPPLPPPQFFFLSTQLTRSQFPKQRLNLGPWQRKPEIQTTRLPEDSPWTV